MALVAIVICILLLSPLATGASFEGTAKPHAGGTATLVIGPSTITLGNSVDLNVTITGDSPPYAYSYADLGATSGCANPGPLASLSNTWTDTCTPTAVGTFTIETGVSDLNLNIMVATANLIVNPAPLSITAFDVTPSPIDLGNATTLSVSATGGTPPYSYSLVGLPPGCTNNYASVLTCTPTAYGTYTPGVYVNDSASSPTQYATSSLTVNPAPLMITSFTASVNPVIVTGTTFLNVTAAGGYNASGYTYSYAGLPPGCLSTSTNSLSCTPNKLGTYSVNATVTDANFDTASMSLSLVVNPEPLTITAFSASPNPILINQTSKFTTTIGGGVTPYTISYSGLPTGCTSSNSATLSCTPTVSGNFTVSANVTDANKTSVTKSTVLAVNPLPLLITSFTASPASFTIGNSTNLSVTATGGTKPYSYSYVALPKGCNPSSGAVLTCKPTISGTFTVRVYVNDSGLKTGSRTTSFTVIPAPLVITSFTATPSTFVIGNATKLAVSVTGGVSPYIYSYTGLPAGCTTVNASTLSCRPSVTGPYSITVTVKDEKGKEATMTASIDVETVGALVITSFTVTPASPSVGSPMQLSVKVTGGKAPYAYSYSNLPPPCTSSNSWNLTCTPGTNGTYKIVVTVTDSGKNSTSSNTTVDVTGVAPALTVSMTSNMASVTAGSPIVLTASASGGTGPYHYVWVLNGVAQTSPQVSNTWDTTLSTAGTYSFQVKVIDATGLTVESKAVQVQVNASTGKGGPSTPFPWWILIVVAAVALLLIIFVIVRRRKMRKAAEEDAAAAEAAALGGAGAFMGSSSAGPEGGLEAGSEVPMSQGPMEPQAMPLTGGPDGQGGSLTQCPQCGGSLGPDMSCQTCKVIWTPPEEAARWGMGGSQPAGEGPQPETGASEAGPGEVHTVETVVPPQTKLTPTPSQPIYSEESAPGAVTLPSETGKTEEKPPEPATVPSEATNAEEKPPEGEDKASGPEKAKDDANLPKVCIVCGSELKGDYCALCDMHWGKGQKP